MKQVKIGIVGLGFMGTTHWGIYKGLKNAKIIRRIAGSLAFMPQSIAKSGLLCDAVTEYDKRRGVF